MRKQLLTGILTVVWTASVCSGCGNSSTSSDITVLENQRLAYAVVTTIEGNDISYMEVEESQLNLSDTSAENEDANQDGKTKNSGMPEMSSEMNMENFDPSSMGDGQMPDMENFDPSSMGDGQMPDMENFDPSSMGERPSEDSTETQSSRRGGGMGGGMMGGATTSTQIPVGVAVHTTADTKTTFSRIQSGDILKILFETDADGNEVIVEIWMVQ